MKLTLRLPVFSALAFVIFAVVVSAILIVEGRSTLASAEYEHLSLNVRSYAAAIQFYFQSANDELDLTAELIAPALREDRLGPRTAEKARGILKAVVGNSTIFDFVELASPDGTVSLIEPEALEKNLYTRDIGFRRWFQDAVRTRTPTVSNLFITVPTRLPAVAVAVPVLDSHGRMLAVLEGAIRPGELSRAGAPAEGGRKPERYGFLTDGHGLVIAHQVRPRFVTEQTDFSAEPPVKAALQGKDGTMTFFDPRRMSSRGFPGLTAIWPVSSARKTARFGGTRTSFA